MVSWGRKPPVWAKLTIAFSCDELYRDGGKGMRLSNLQLEPLIDLRLEVREATNNEPWGASSTLMQEIANATHS